MDANPVRLLDREFRSGCHGARRMNAQLYCQIDSPVSSSGARSIAKALLVSLCVHAILLGVFWHVASSRREPAQRDLRVQLSPVARPEAPAAAQPAPAAAAPEHSAAPTNAQTERRVRTHQAVNPLPARPEDKGETGTGAPIVAGAAEASIDLVESRPAQQAGMPIDLRVLDWLSQYRSYPFAARRARIEGVVHMRVTLLPDGRLVDARIEQSSGHAVLDQAALELLIRAAPLPGDFGSVRTTQIELQLPIVYRMRAS